MQSKQKQILKTLLSYMERHWGELKLFEIAECGSTVFVAAESGHAEEDAYAKRFRKTYHWKIGPRGRLQKSVWSNRKGEYIWKNYDARPLPAKYSLAGLGL